MLPNVIIGGVQKAGTTSLFRYLAAHPCVCASSIKEIDFFLKHNEKIDASATQQYESFFSRCQTEHSIRLEASPQYLMYSSMVAKRIFKFLPHIKIIFILREPVSALLSYIKFKPGVSKEKWSVQSFTTIAQNGKQFNNNDNEEVDKKRVMKRLQAGCYVNSMKNFLSYFPKDQIGIFFYDQLLTDTIGLMSEICDFINIDKKFYENYQFLIENKTRSYKWPNFHRFVTRINLKLEPFFNRYSFVRNALRGFYHSFCEVPEEPLRVSDADILEIKNFYTPFNDRLRYFLMHNYPNLELPGWLDVQNYKPLKRD